MTESWEPSRAEPPASDVVLRFDSVAYRYGETVAVADLTLEVRRGETFGLIGPDGAGKTTALRLALGLLRPHEGSVTSLGLDPGPDRRRLSQRVGYLSQRFSIYGDLSIDENIAFFARAHQARDWKPRREELLRRLDLERFRSRLADRLSGGMKQKLALACTLIHTPELLVLDEPTTGVDPISRREFWRILSELQREGITLIVTTPYLDEAERCGRVGLIDQGRLLDVDAPGALRGASAGSMLEVIASPRPDAIAALRDLAGVGEVESFGERIHALLPQMSVSEATGLAEQVASALQERGVEVQSIRAVKPSLEDVFIQRLRSRSATVRRSALMVFVFLLALGIRAATAQEEPDWESVGPAAQDRADWESVAPIRLSLEDALARAQEVSPKLLRLDALTESALGAEREARAARYPDLSAGASYTRLSEERSLELTIPGRGTVALSPDIPNRWRSRFGLSWPLWTGGRIGNSIEATRAAVAAAEHEREGGEQDLVIEVTRAYWSWVVALERIEVLEASQVAHDQHHDDVSHLLEVGLAAPNDLLQTEVARDRLHLDRLNAGKDAEIAEENLRRLLATRAPLEPGESLSFDLPPIPVLDSLRAAALESRPERSTLRARLASARAREGMARAGRLPQISMYGGYDYANPNTRILPPEERWDDSWDVGVQFSWSLFDGGKVSGALQRARGEAHALEAQLLELDRAIELEVFARRKELETAREAAAVSEMTLSAAEENLAVVRNRFQQGLLTAADLLDAEASALRAALDRTAAYAELRIAAAALDRAVGRLSADLMR